MKASDDEARKRGVERDARSMAMNGAEQKSSELGEGA